VSRRNYIATAAILRDATLTPKQRQELARRFVTMYADDNPRFSPSRFLAAVEEDEAN
jgi:hypothetical protein